MAANIDSLNLKGIRERVMDVQGRRDILAILRPLLLWKSAIVGGNTFNLFSRALHRASVNGG